MPTMTPPSSPTWRTRLAILGFAIVCIGVASFLGESYISRLPNHAGYFLVAVEDAVTTPPVFRPRRTFFVVVDGLRRDAAETMKVVAALERSGQCRISDQGPYTVSRPEYALLSTGLEVDRSGARNNDLTAPLFAESVWEVARRSGLRVTGSSHLPWFAQLFPRGFDRFTALEELSADVFAATTAPLGDVNVFHPLYVDEEAHLHGAAGASYAAAVARVDREIAGLLERVDLDRDLVVLTADHGHRDAGGHGGAQPEIKDVLACFAGPNVARRSDRARFDGRVTGPLLSVLLGLPFPKHMRAGDDGLDAVWEVTRRDDDEGATYFGAPYLEERRRAVERFREENRVALERWLGDAPGVWSRLYAREARAQDVRVAALGLAACAVFLVVMRRRRASARAVLRTALFLVATAVVIWLVHRAVLGELDYTVVNRRAEFVPRAFVVSTVSAALSVLVHAFIVRDRERRVGDGVLVVALLLALNLGHVVVYGWPLGFPLPPAAARYFPFFGAVVLAAYAGALVPLVLWDWRRQRPGPPPPTNERGGGPSGAPGTAA